MFILIVSIRMDYLKPRMDEIITQLVDTIYEHQEEEYSILLEYFNQKVNIIFVELSEWYSEKEIETIQERIQNYNFTEMINSVCTEHK